MVTVVPRKVCVVGASGPIGAAAARHFASLGWRVAGTGRSADRLALLDERIERCLVDVRKPGSLERVLTGCEVVVSCIHARYTPEVLAAAASAGAGHVVLLCSTRRFSAVPDKGTTSTINAEAAFLDGPMPGFLLHSTMIYGPGITSSLDRIAALIDRYGIVVLPAGGRTRLQPIHIDDVVAALAAAAATPTTSRESFVIACPDPLCWRDIVRLIGKARGRRVRILPLPGNATAWLAHLAVRYTRLPRAPLRAVQRMMEDMVFDVAPQTRRLGSCPMAAATGIGRAFAVHARR